MPPKHETEKAFWTRIHNEGRTREAKKRRYALVKEGTPKGDVRRALISEFQPLDGTGAVPWETPLTRAVPADGPGGPHGTPAQNQQKTPARVDDAAQIEVEEGTDPDPRRDMLWAYHNLGNDQPKRAPSSGAVEQWRQARKNPQRRWQFLQMVNQRLVTPKDLGARAGELEESEAVGLENDLLERIQSRRCPSCKGTGFLPESLMTGQREANEEAREPVEPSTEGLNGQSALAP